MCICVLTVGTGVLTLERQPCLQGPARLVNTKGYSTTMAISVMKHLLMLNVLRRGDGLYKIPDSRRTERLFGEHGQTKLLSAGIKL